MSDPQSEMLRVFLDAEPIVAARFRFESGALERFEQLCRWRRLELLVTEMLDGEVRVKLDEEVESAVAAFQSFSSKAEILKSHRPAAFVPFEKGTAQQAQRRRWRSFLERCNARIVQTPPDTLGAVVNRYLNMDAPFGSGRKRAEFPDAISVHALEAWCDSREVRCHVVSRDADLRRASEESTHLEHVETLQDLFSLIAEEDQKALALVEGAMKDIEREVAAQFERGGFYLEDADGDVEHVEVTDVNIRNAFLHEVTDCDILFQVGVELSYEAEATFRDYATAVYDSEEKRHIAWDMSTRSVSGQFIGLAYGHFVASDTSLAALSEKYLNLDTGGMSRYWRGIRITEACAGCGRWRGLRATCALWRSGSATPDTICETPFQHL